MKKLRWFFEHVEEIISSILMFTVFFLLALTILFRLIGITASGLQEIVQYSFVISILFGISYGVKENAHIRADIILSLVSEKTKKAILLIDDFIWLFFTVCLFYFSIPLIQNMLEFPSKTPILGMPYWMLYLMVPVSAGLTIIRLIHSILPRLTKQQ